MKGQVMQHFLVLVTARKHSVYIHRTLVAVCVNIASPHQCYVIPCASTATRGQPLLKKVFQNVKAAWQLVYVCRVLLDPLAWYVLHIRACCDISDP